jgi:membrane fusion protein, multidrug efflux system
MKKTITISTIVVIITAMILILLLNKKETKNRTELASKVTNSISVQMDVAKNASYNMSFKSNGALEPIHELTFVSDVAGRVVNILVDEGSYVNKGTVLIKVDDEMLKADYQANEAAYHALQTDYERFSNVSEKGGVSTQQLDNIRTQLSAAQSRYIASKRRYTDATVKSPISGEINSRYVEVGAYLNPGIRLFDIIDDSQLKLTVNVTERQVLMLKKGMSVNIVCNTFPGESYNGTISFIGAKADRSLNYPVEITINGKEKKKLKAGMFVTANFEIKSDGQGILIPRNAIIGSVKNANVYVVKNGIAEIRPVVVGAVIEKNVEILDGLRPGDSIIIAGQINVSDGVQVKAKKSGKYENF